MSKVYVVLHAIQDLLKVVATLLICIVRLLIHYIKHSNRILQNCSFQREVF